MEAADGVENLVCWLSRIWLWARVLVAWGWV